MSPPQSLLSRNPLRWISVFGPGAIIASLTIGVGELVFSSRAGALFGYRILWYFAVLLALKWVLVYGSARHIVLSNAHPFERWMDLPGRRGWFPIVFFLLALPCFPIWICFHAGAVGTLLSHLAGTEQALSGGAYHLWGAAMLVATLTLSFLGGYAALERVQLGVVLLMLAAVTLAVFFVQLDWLEFVSGLLLPQPLRYPDWIASQPEIASRPIWVETATYVGVIGGSSYDYLAYTSYVREKGWGRARAGSAEAEQPGPASTEGELRCWLRAPLIDCTLSFLAVFIFTAVFLILGAVILGPQGKVPAGANLLSFQAEFVAAIHPSLKTIYFAGALLAVLGTLYGTIEVAPTVARELLVAFVPRNAVRWRRRVRLWSVAWVGVGGLLVLLGSFAYHLSQSSDAAANPRGLIAILTPANLFTGVLGCGLICALNVWMERYLPPRWRMPWPLRALSVAASGLFLGLGLKGYWDHSRWLAFFLLGATLALGWVGAVVITRKQRA